MELLQLQYFVAVAQGETLSQAAERFNISQSSLSRSLSMLEEELGVELFIRTGKRLQPTARGEILMLRVRPLLIGLEEAKASVDANEEELGLVAFCADLMIPHLTEALEEYRALHPQQRVSFRMPLLPGSIYHDPADLILTGAPVPVSKDFHAVLCQEEMMLLVPKAYRPAEREVDLADFGERRLLIMPTGASGARVACETLCRYTGFDPKVIGETDSLGELAQRLDRENMAAFVTAYRMGAIPEGLAAVRIREPDPLRNIYLCWNEHPAPAAAALRDFLIEYYRRPTLRNILQETLDSLGIG